MRISRHLETMNNLIKGGAIASQCRAGAEKLGSERSLDVPLLVFSKCLRKRLLVILSLVRLIHLCSLILCVFSDIRHLDIVLNELKIFGNDKWQKFGLEAGLDYSTLKAIKADNPGDVDACCCECVASWLKRQDNVDDKGKPTLLRLANIVEEIGDRAAADGIRNKIKEKEEERQKSK